MSSDVGCGQIWPKICRHDPSTTLPMYPLPFIRLFPCFSVILPRTSRSYEHSQHQLQGTFLKGIALGGSYPMVQNFEDMIAHFDTIHECDGQTNRRIDIARRHRPRLCIASRDKNVRKTMMMMMMQ